MDGFVQNQDAVGAGFCFWLTLEEIRAQDRIHPGFRGGIPESASKRNQKGNSIKWQ